MEFTKNEIQAVQRAARGVCYRHADDIAATALLKAWENRGSYKGDCKLTTWLTRVTINTGINYMKSRDRYRSRIGVDNDAECNTDTIEEQLIADDRYKEILKVLSTLHPINVKAFVLYYTKDLTHKDLAVKLGGTEGTNKARVSRVLKQLTTALN